MLTPGHTRQAAIQADRKPGKKKTLFIITNKHLIQSEESPGPSFKIHADNDGEMCECNCPSSNDLEPLILFGSGGSGLFGFHVMRPAAVWHLKNCETASPAPLGGKDETGSRAWLNGFGGHSAVRNCVRPVPFMALAGHEIVLASVSTYSARRCVICPSRWPVSKSVRTMSP